MAHPQRRVYLATIAIVGLIVWLLWPTERVNPKSACQLSAGMSLGEVEQILGKPLDQSRYIIMITSTIIVDPPPLASPGASQPSGLEKQESPSAASPIPSPQVKNDSRYHYRLMPKSPWDVTLELFGEPLPANWGPGFHTEFWAGSQVVVVGVFREEKTGEFLEHYLVVPVLRDGGGPLGWLKHHYQEWSCPGSSTLAAPALPPVPITPPPFITQPIGVGPKEASQVQSKTP